jgi:2-polyprenyl-3-methyl-5-hydroxy-6-metoxy-1,4-benzoquinol methylase
VLTIVATIVTIGVPFIVLSNEQKVKFYKKIKFVFWTVWSPECKEIDNNHFNNQQKTEKEKIYVDMNAIKVFQEHFVPYSREAELIKAHFNSGKSQFKLSTGNLKMLDIGGYNGVFTVKLLKQLHVKIDSIEVVEPIDVEVDYRRNLSPEFSNINFVKNKLEEYNSNSTFNLVLASHSLYSSIDNKKYDNNQAFINNLLSFLDKDGIIIVILGNSNGKAYSLKKELNKLILNEETQDTNSYEFEDELKRQTEICYEKISIDNYIEIKKILQEEQTLKEWVSYFARVPIVEDKHTMEGIKDLFNIFSVKY